MITGPYILTEKLWFPPANTADDEGLLAIGGDLSTGRLLLAYRQGIFPWFEGDLPLWWNPDPRFVLFPDQLYVSKSMQQVLKRNVFTFTKNQCFARVIEACKTTSRPGQEGTWITEAVQKAYIKLHQQGYAHSYEAWHENQLAGGFYGIRMGNIFFGESMFSHASNASKAAFIWAVQQMKNEGIVLIDCQVYTDHLKSLGAGFISRKDFLAWLKEHVGDSNLPGPAPSR